MRNKLMQYLLIPEPERGELLRSGLLTIARNKIELADKEQWTEWLISTLLYSENLKRCTVCSGMVHFIGSFEGIPIFRCTDCLSFYYIGEYNMLESYKDKEDGH